ncbi:tetratricopeptide repeat protein [Fuerstiella marisgermanici]|uniref:Bacteriophage N4 receptor, outer membrane subunit n=1 Tax=Fuerstiella marisgermanici TaxID=1891926 RepID=A0A1P8WJT9_9PLAN|nr:tetratricopeptide repeat protein [Fuerstiella marisgermanici]APZ94313.1 bacteriophage N4 receptor, outer membrane subunit [Fuerstiella marisgermanici]
MSDDQQNPDQMYDAANALKDAGDLEGAVEALFKVLEVDPDHLHANMALGVHLQKLGRLDESIKHAVRVTEIQPDDPFSFTQLSVIYQRCGRIPEAEDAMAQAHVLQGRPASTGQPDSSQHAGGGNG